LASTNKRVQWWLVWWVFDLGSQFNCQVFCCSGLMESRFSEGLDMFTHFLVIFYLKDNKKLHLTHFDSYFLDSYWICYEFLKFGFIKTCPHFEIFTMGTLTALKCTSVVENTGNKVTIPMARFWCWRRRVGSMSVPFVISEDVLDAWQLCRWILHETRLHYSS